jgi:hypothetical protein
MSGYESGSDEGQTPIGHIVGPTGLPVPAQTGTREAHAKYFEDRYVTVLANLRGTGCSSGEFDRLSWRSALDGKEVIDDWDCKAAVVERADRDLRPLRGQDAVAADAAAGAVRRGARVHGAERAVPVRVNCAAWRLRRMWRSSSPARSCGACSGWPCGGRAIRC